MDDRHLDELLMSEVGTRYRKVARIIGGALNRLEQADPSKAIGWPGREGPDEVFDALLERVNALVDAGTLKAQGNTWWPRYSEVRLPNDDDRERAAARLDEREVDVVLLSLANHRWQKVLKVVSQALDGLGRESKPKPPWWPAEKEDIGWVWDAITERIELLVAAGRLEARGNIWRLDRSEIRLADAAPVRSAAREPPPDTDPADRAASLEADRVDSVLLSLLDDRFDRVARIVARTLEQLRPEGEFSTADTETVFTRIETLVGLGTIEANGDIRHIEYSRIRLADAALVQSLSHGSLAEIVARRGSMDPDEVDTVLLSLLDPPFRKVVRMVVDTVEALRPPESGVSDEDVDAVLARIEALIASGMIEANGDVRQIHSAGIRLCSRGAPP